MVKSTNSTKDSLSINVRVSGALKRHVEATTSDGDYESVSEYVRDLVRKDKAAADELAFQAVSSHLKAAFNQPRDSYKPYTLEMIKEIAKARRG
jgi:antitoxin ParD1/3/4